MFNYKTKVQQNIMDILKDLKLDREQIIPLYVQIADSVKYGVSKGSIKMNDKLPSINVLSKKYDVSRDTIDKAYSLLKEKKIIIGKRGKGFYINRTDLISKRNVLFLIDELTPYKLKTYNAFLKNLDERFHTNFEIYNNDCELFLNLLKRNINQHDFYVFMLHFENSCFGQSKLGAEFLDIIAGIPREKLVFIDNNELEIGEDVIQIYQDIENDIYNALKTSIDKISKYNRLNLVMVNNLPNLDKIRRGCVKFCNKQLIDFNLINNFEDIERDKLEGLFVIINDEDLFKFIDIVKNRGLVLGSELGIISYNESPFKRLLDIAVISMDYIKMGATLADLLINNKKEKIKNPFSLIDRGSF